MRFKHPPRVIPDLIERLSERGLTLADAAREVGVTESTTWWVRHRGVSLSTYNKFKKLLIAHPVLEEAEAELVLAAKRERVSAVARAARLGIDLTEPVAAKANGGS